MRRRRRRPRHCEALFSRLWPDYCLAEGSIVLLLIYAKSARDNIPAEVLRRIVKEI